MTKEEKEKIYNEYIKKFGGFPFGYGFHGTYDEAIEVMKECLKKNKEYNPPKIDKNMLI